MAALDQGASAGDGGGVGGGGGDGEGGERAPEISSSSTAMGKARKALPAVAVRVYLAGFGRMGKGLHDFGVDASVPVENLPATDEALRAIIERSFGVPPSSQNLSFVDPANLDRYDRFQPSLPNLTVELMAKPHDRVRFSVVVASSGERFRMFATPWTTAAHVIDQLLQGPPAPHRPRPPPHSVDGVDVSSRVEIGGEILAGDARLCDHGLSDGASVKIVRQPQ